MSEAVVNHVPLSSAKWIWADGGQVKNDLCIFRKVFKISGKLRKPTLRIACDTRYYLNINGNFVVWEGGINHPGGIGFNGYYDEIDVSKIVKKGVNSIVVICHYYGNSGGTCIDKGRSGFIAELVNGDNVVMATDREFTVYRNEAFKSVAIENATVNYAGASFSYDSTLERPLNGIYTASYNSNIFTESLELCAYGEHPFGQLAKRPIPYYNFNQKIVLIKKPEKRQKDEGTFIYTIKLPVPMYIYPVINAKALGMEKIIITSDRSTTSGDVGDKRTYTGYGLEYICKAQKQLFESFVPIYGQEIYLEIPKSVKVAKLGYRFVETNAAAVGSFVCNDSQITGLAAKAINTLKACQTDSIINNVERDRALSLDAANIAIKTLLKTFDEGCLPLIKKTICDVLDTAKNGFIQNNVLSLYAQEIPSMGLLTISGQGMLAAYSDYYSDMDQKFLDCGVQYLSKWAMIDGLVAPRGGFMDNLYNIDYVVLENALYYSALVFMKQLSARLGSFEHEAFIKSRLDGFKSAFGARFFNGLGFSSQPNYSDDRANAFAVLTGLCGEDKYGALSDLLVSVQNASPYFEGFVLEALAKMGKISYVQRRMTSRYAGMVENSAATLREDFCLGGAQTAARSVMPIAVMLENFAGVSVKENGTDITITPQLGDLNSITFACAVPKGIVKGEYKRNLDGTIDCSIALEAKQEATVILNSPDQEQKTFKISKGKYKYTI